MEDPAEQEGVGYQLNSLGLILLISNDQSPEVQHTARLANEYKKCTSNTHPINPTWICYRHLNLSSSSILQKKSHHKISNMDLMHMWAFFCREIISDSEWSGMMSKSYPDDQLFPQIA